jgi:hypothetical protein
MYLVRNVCTTQLTNAMKSGGLQREFELYIIKENYLII